MRGPAAGMVGYLDDDDRRDRDEFTAVQRCEQLMHRVAPDFASFWTALRPIPPELDDLARHAAGGAEIATPDGLGALLPASHRRPA